MTVRYNMAEGLLYADIGPGLWPDYRKITGILLIANSLKHEET